MKQHFKLSFIFCATVCSRTSPPASNQTQNHGREFERETWRPRRTSRRPFKPVADSEVAVIETADYGRIVIELYPNIAPQHVERFKRLINEKFYDGTAIHRSIRIWASSRAAIR